MSGSTDLSVQIGPMQLKNPVLPASGTFGYGQEYEDFIDLNRLGGIIVKGTTLKPRTGSLPHRSTEVASGMLATVGLQNVGVERFIRDKLPYFKQIDSRLIVNVGGHSFEEYVKVVDILNREKRIDALEVNISCPNVAQGGMRYGIDPEVSKDLVTRLREATDKTLIIKLTPMAKDLRVMAEMCQVCGADGVSLINAPMGMAIDIDTRRSKLGRNITGGLVGPAIKPIALHMVYQVAQVVDIPVIGIGGISSTADAIEFFIAGATAIEIGTWNFVEPGITVEVVEGIENYLQTHSMKSMSELIGSFIS